MRRFSLGSADGTAWIVRAAALPARSPDDLAPAAGLLAAGIPAVVPGEVHTDLLCAGLIPDPFDGSNETGVQWIGGTDWTWSTRFEWPSEATPGLRHDLVLSGVDTLATVRLNGTEVARTANQHRTYRIDVGGVLLLGDNTLEVAIEAPYEAAERRSAELGPRPRAYRWPFNALRKRASAYGWDWGPDLAGAGLLGEVAVETWAGVRAATVRPHARWVAGTGVLTVNIDLEWAGAAEVEVTVSCAGVRASGSVPGGTASTSLRLDVPAAEPWWPRGYGAQPLCEVAVDLAGVPVWLGRVGFRSVSLSTAPDEVGREFVLAVNGSPVYVKGANWIPADALMSRLTADTYAASLTDASAAGLNLLRVWGGGIYESEEFYDRCDELGILVWQDFLFACAAYSEDEPLRGEVEAEAREAITRLSRHPSLVLWNGNNENFWGFVDWGWRTELRGASWGDGYYRELLPRLVGELAPGTPYTPGSPYSFPDLDPNSPGPNDPRHGTTHIWDVWNARDYTGYADYAPRLVAEFGFQGPAAWSTLAAVVHDEPLDPDGPQLLAHQKAADGNRKLERGLGAHLPRWPVRDGLVDMADWHWTTSLNQARAVAFGIAHFRSRYPLNRGAVVWQLNDQWPAISWAAVDSAGIRKPVWYALRQVFADRFVTVQPRPVGLTVVLHNDTDEPWTTKVATRRRGTGAGSPVLAEQTDQLVVAARELAEVALLGEVATPAESGAELLEVVTAGARTHHYFVEDPALSVLPAEQAYEVAAVRTSAGYDVTVTAAALVKDLTLFPDRIDPAARVDSGLVTLLAGASHTFAVTRSAVLDEVALTRRPVLRSANDLLSTPDAARPETT